MFKNRSRRPEDELALGKRVRATVARKSRLKYPAAVYHLLNRRDWREPIFRDDTDPHEAPGPLFPAVRPDDVLELFTIVAEVKKIALADEIKAYIREHLGNRPLTGSDVEAILTRAKERAELAKRDDDVQLGVLEEAVNSFIHPLDPELLALQEPAAVLACSDRRYLPERYLYADTRR